MSDEAPAEENAEGPPKPKPPMIIVGLLAVNLLVSAATLVKSMGSAPHVAAAHAEGHGESASKEVVGPMATLDPFVVNLDEPGSPRYLKVTLQLEMRDAAAVKVLEKNKTLVRDAVLGYLSGLKIQETLGAENKTNIRTELAEQIAEILGEERVRRVVFSEFVVQ